MWMEKHWEQGLNLVSLGGKGVGEWKSKQFHGQLMWVILVGMDDNAPSPDVWVGVIMADG